MGRARISFRCRDCGAPSPRWTGRCPTCGEWNTVEEEIPDPVGAPGAGTGVDRAGADRRPALPPVEMHAVDGADQEVLTTGMAEFDRVLGGGLTPGSVTLLAGEPGTGKSTLLLQMLSALAAGGHPSLLVSAEESLPQVRRRAGRLGAVQPGMWVAAETDLARLRASAADLAVEVVVVDSIQTVSDPATGSPPGSVAQVKACAQALADDAKSGGPAVVLVGHVTKDGSIAGPRVLEHLVDTVLTFEGERRDSLRLLRAVKHRFGPVGELGMWEMTSAGLAEVADAGALLLADRASGVPGSVVFAAMDGRRPLLVEVQALVGPGVPGSLRRSASGYDGSRLGQLLAVLERRAGLPLGAQDVFVSAVGGVRLVDPGADLAVALAVASAATGRVVDPQMVALGEVGLAGELRRVPDPGRRLSEAARMGFGRVLAPPGTAVPDGLRLAEASNLHQALDRHLGRATAAPRLRVVGSGHSG